MTVLLNLLRVLAAGVWTTIVGAPLVVALYSRYWYGLLQAKLGRRDRLDQALEANAHLAGWVAQRLWAGVLLGLAGIRLRVREVVPVDWSTAHVVCANHASIFDILALVCAVSPPFRFVAKRELLSWPIIGWALRPAGQIVPFRQCGPATTRWRRTTRPTAQSGRAPRPPASGCATPHRRTGPPRRRPVRRDPSSDGARSKPRSNATPTPGVCHNAPA